MDQLLLLLAIAINLLLFTLPSSAQQAPPIACPQYFEYLGYNDQFVGRVSVRHDAQLQDNTVRLEFSQRGLLSSNYVGSLTLWDDEETTKANLRYGRPIQYRVDFPTPGVLPKLTLLMINDVLLCRASPYPPSSVTLSLSHSLRSTTVPLITPNFVNDPYPRPWRPNGFEQSQTDDEPGFRVPQLAFPAPQPPQPPPPRPSRPSQPQPPPPPRPTQRATPIQRPRPPPRPSSTGSGLGQLSEICGREGPVTSPLIHFGTQVRRGQLPWMAALYERGADGLRFFCGGTLVSASTVLSAAHCFRYAERDLPASRTAVSLGRNTLDIVSEGLLREISVLLVHERYSPRNYTDADIALLRLSSPVSFGEYVKPICLWNENFQLQLPSGYKSYVAGWGSDENGNENTRVAKMTDTDIVTESECLRNLRSTEGVRLVTPNTICASNQQAAGPCSGDSGGGLMLQENNIWLLRGVVSAGQVFTNRCDLTQPVIYTDLARHISWLRQNIWV